MSSKKACLKALKQFYGLIPCEDKERSNIKFYSRIIDRFGEELVYECENELTKKYGNIE